MSFLSLSCVSSFLSLDKTSAFLTHRNDLVPPQAVLVELGEAVDHNGDGQGEDEDPREGTEAPDQFSLE